MPRAYSYEVTSNPQPDESDLSVLFAGESQTRPGHAIGPRVYDYCLIHHVLEGRGEFECEGKTYSLSEGDCFVILPETLVAYRADETDPWHYRWVALRGKLADAFLAKAGFSTTQPVVLGERADQASPDRAESADRWFAAIQDALREGGSAVNLQAAGYLLLLLSRYAERLSPAAEHKRGGDSRIEQQIRAAIHAITTQYSETLTIEGLAEELGYNRAYFSKMFKRFTGKTPVTFLLETRLHKARLLLREREELTVEQIAFSAGFADPLYFSKQFKRYYGQSPTSYRRSVQPANPGNRI